jgi:DNA-binding response OmpR family regulator
MKEGRVLVVDDEPMVRDTLGQFLSDEGYVVDLAVDGEAALERVHAARPDAILLDLMMPGMNGRQFLQALRDEPAYASVPVLIMTAVHGLEVNLATLGASEVVEKPFNVEELLNKVALAVYRSRGESPVRVQTAQHEPASSPPAEALPAEALPAKAIILTRPAPDEQGVVLVVEQDRARLQALDLQLSQRGYTVVSMTRALVQLSRLARALRPRAILLDLRSEHAQDVLSELRGATDLASIPILPFTRAEIPSDQELVEFVERAR